MPEPFDPTELLQIAAALRDTAARIEQVAKGLAPASPISPTSNGHAGLAIDRDALTVRWNGQSCFLGYTTAFRLIERLAKRPNHYVPHDQLLEDVWGGHRSKSAIRSAVNDLRARLAHAGMADVAQIIDGQNPGHYGLIVRRLP